MRIEPTSNHVNREVRELTPQQVQAFIERGFIVLPRAFPKSLADEALKILWRDTGCDPADPSTWTKPVIRLGDYPQAPFAQAVNTPRLHGVFDQLVKLADGSREGASEHFLSAFPRLMTPVMPAGTSIQASGPRRRLHVMASQRHFEGTSASDAVLVLGCGTGRGSNAAFGSALTWISRECSRQRARTD